jgi:predicted RNase H-like HicB family nuclease
MSAIVELRIRLDVHFEQDEDTWVALCPTLDVCSQGDSKPEALDSLREAIQAWFESCLARRVLAKALEEVGFHLVKPGDPVVSQTNTIEVGKVEEIEISVPAYIADALNNNREYATC